MGDEFSGRPRALLITRNLPPLLGGMERLVQHIARSLDERYEVSVIGPIGCTTFLPQRSSVIEIPWRPLPRFLAAALFAVQKFGRQSHALVIAGSGLAAPMAWWAARRTGAKLAVYLHGLDIIAPSKTYQRFWLPFIRRADVVLVNSSNTRLLAVAQGVPPSVIQVLHPGTDLPAPDPDARQRFRASNGLNARPILLSVGRLTKRKGLANFVRHSMQLVLAEYPDALLLVIGADANDAVRKAVDSERENILNAAREAGVEASVRMLPPCDDETLSAAYRAADVHVFPVVDVTGDVEGFGMVAIEAAAHGLRTVAFAVGGVPDAVVDGITGSLVPVGDYAGFAMRVQRWIGGRDDEQMRARCVEAASAYGWDRFSSGLHVALSELVRSAA